MANAKHLNAQIIFNSSDYAEVNDSFVVSTLGILDVNSFDFETAGANVLWDYSGFNPSSQKIKTYANPNRTGFAAPYLLSCGALCFNDCYNNCMANGGISFICGGSCNISCGAQCLNNWATLFDLAELSNDSINLFITTLRDVYNFYHHTSNVLEQVAIGARISNFPIVIEMENPDVVYDFPLAYGNIDSSHSGYALDLDSIPGTGINLSFTYKHGQTRYNNVEGWGTLTTPFGTFDSVIKVKSVILARDTVIFQNDTLTLNQFLPSQYVPEKTVEYKWFSKDFGIPLLKAVAWEINGSLVFREVEYIDSLRCFDPFSLFGYLPLVASIDQGSDSVEVSFYNLSINSDHLYWDFGDNNSTNNSAAGQNPTHWYSEGGVYSVHLVSCNTACPDFICDTLTLPVFIRDLRGAITDTTDTMTYININPDISAKVFPNPFNQSVSIELNLVKNQPVTIEVYNMQGIKVKTLVSEVFKSGTYLHTFSLQELPAAAYILVMRSSGFNKYVKLIKNQNLF